MNKIFLLIFSVLLVSCNGAIDAVLKLSEEVTFNTKYSGAVAMKAGKYKVKVSHDEKSRYLKLEFPREDSGFPGGDDYRQDKSYEVRFNYPEGTIIPDDNGDFFISSEESGQNVNLNGLVETTVNKGGLKRDYETCEIRERRTDCYADRRGRVVCHDRWDIVYGRRDVEYYPITTTKTIDIALSYPTKDSLAGEMHIKQTDTRRDYVYQGYCHY